MELRPALPRGNLGVGVGWTQLQVPPTPSPGVLATLPRYPGGGWTRLLLPTASFGACFCRPKKKRKYLYVCLCSSFTFKRQTGTDTGEASNDLKIICRNSESAGACWGIWWEFYVTNMADKRWLGNLYDVSSWLYNMPSNKWVHKAGNMSTSGHMYYVLQH